MAEPNKPEKGPSSAKVPTEINNSHASDTNKSFSGQKVHFPNPPDPSISGQKVHFPNPPDPSNPDPATLREQWKFAIRQYSRWYSHAWGTAILAGVSFFALGWIIKGSNPLPSFGRRDDSPRPPDKTDEAPR